MTRTMSNQNVVERFAAASTAESPAVGSPRAEDRRWPIVELVTPGAAHESG